jgi:hypothetical protein
VTDSSNRCDVAPACPDATLSSSTQGQMPASQKSAAGTTKAGNISLLIGVAVLLLL